VSDVISTSDGIQVSPHNIPVVAAMCPRWSSKVLSHVSFVVTMCLHEISL